MKRNRFQFDPAIAPRCQQCATRRLEAGERLQRLVHKPRTIGYCVDCGAVVWNDRPLKRAA